VISGTRGARRHPPRARGARIAAVLVAAATLTGGLIAALVAAPAAVSAQSSTRETGPWVRAWAWRAGHRPLPAGCAALTGATLTGAALSGRAWSPRLVTGTSRGVLVAAGAGSRAAGAGLACTQRAVRYGRLVVHARLPRAVGLVSRIAFWPQGPSRGSDWSGISVPASPAAPAYVTNGCGARAAGVTVAGRLAGRFHTWSIAWTPRLVTVSVDGRELFRDSDAYARPRWPVITLGSTGATVPKEAALLVDAVELDRYTGPPPAPKASAAPAGGQPAHGQADLGDGPGFAPDVPLATPLEGAPLSAPWLVGGACVTLAVLAGVLRAALRARRRAAQPTSAGAPPGRRPEAAAPAPSEGP
jgi:hypothetical protein